MKAQLAGWVEQLDAAVLDPLGTSFPRSIFDDLSACGKYTPLPVTLTGLSLVADRRKQESDTTLL
jgi:hypothetical protein